MTNPRLLTVEEFGDTFQARVMPTKLASQIRLKGQWLKRCGFPAGSLAKVTIVAPGVLDIRLVGENPSGTSAPSDSPAPVVPLSVVSSPAMSPETPEQKSARQQVMERLDSAIAFVDRAAVAKGRAILEAELQDSVTP